MSRAAILANVRSALKVEARHEAERRASAEARLARAGAHLIPARGRLGGAERVASFASHLASQGTDLIEVGGDAEIPAAIAAYLAARGLALRLRVGTDPVLAALPWSGDLVCDSGPARAGDTAGLSRAIAGVAETGTLVLASSADNPTTIGLLLETHLVVLKRERIVGSYEDAMALVAAELGAGVMPRVLGLVSGASRTGDIGGRIVMGAHGPRRLAVILS